MGPLLVVLLHPLPTDLPHLSTTRTHRHDTSCRWSVNRSMKAFWTACLAEYTGARSHGLRTSSQSGRRNSGPYPVESPGADRARPSPGLTPGGRVPRARTCHPTGQDFPHSFIQNVERPTSSSAVQGIAHEVQCPDGVGLWEHDEGLRRSGEPPLLGPSWQIQPELAIDAP
jgi:hypothetical protein